MATTRKGADVGLTGNGVNVVDAIRDRARERPRAGAITSAGPAGEEPRVLDYATLVERLEHHAARIGEAGIEQGSRVGLLARQGAGFVEAALGILAAGGCMVPIPDDHDGEVLRIFEERAGLHALLRESDAFAPRVLERTRAVDGQQDAAFRALDPAYLRFTSGTTSERKGVVLGHQTILARLEAANRGLRITPDDRILWLLPMAHHFVVSILLYLTRGATLLLPGSSMAGPVLALATQQRASVFYASPYHYNLLAKDPSDTGLPNVRLAISTAEGLRAEIAERFRARFGLALVQALGIIEVGLPVLNTASAATKPTSLGRPLPDYEVWLRDENGSALTRTAPDETGEVCIRGPGLLDAYLDPWLPAAQVLEPDGFRTGDQGYYDADGDLHLVGRRSNRINMAGMKFFSEEVEAVIDQHPQVLTSRVFARDHAHLGEIPVAEIVPEPGGDAPDRGSIARFCKGRLPAYKIPRQVVAVDRLEQTVTGKLKRHRESAR